MTAYQVIIKAEVRAVLRAQLCWLRVNLNMPTYTELEVVEVGLSRGGPMALLVATSVQTMRRTLEDSKAVNRSRVIKMSENIMKRCAELNEACKEENSMLDNIEDIRRHAQSLKAMAQGPPVLGVPLPSSQREWRTWCWTVAGALFVEGMQEDDIVKLIPISFNSEVGRRKWLQRIRLSVRMQLPRGRPRTRE